MDMYRDSFSSSSDESLAALEEERSKRAAGPAAFAFTDLQNASENSENLYDEENMKE